MLTRRKVGRSFVYLPTVSRDEIRRLAVRELVDSLFDGESTQLSAYLNGHSTPMAPASPEPEGPQTLDAALL